MTLAKETNSVREIIEKVARRNHVPLQSIMRRDRRRNVVSARNEAFHEIRERLRWSYPRIAKVFDMDQTTIQHGIASHRGNRDVHMNPAMQAVQDAVRERIRGRILEAME